MHLLFGMGLCVKMYRTVCKKKKSVLENVIKNLENGSGPRM